MPAAPDPDVLRLDDLQFGYQPDRPIIRGLSGRLPPGRVCALIGPNAAGKSTLLKLVLGMIHPEAGGIEVAGRPVGSLGPSARARLMSYVPQRAGVSFAFTVEQVVAMGRFAQRPDPGAIGRALDECDLSHLRGRVFNQLSFGQQQRVLLARAMAQSADHGRLMLLDEPGSAMDLWHVHHMMQSLVALAGRGLGVLVVLHDLNLAARYADIVWLMDDGRLLAAGPWDEVLVPAVLEPVYRVGLRPLLAEGQGRPVFLVEPGGTL